MGSGKEGGAPSDASSREIGNLAVWTVMSAKPGNGVELLRDNRDDTYWQSDGVQPHVVNIQFQRKVCLLTSRATALEVASRRWVQGSAIVKGRSEC